MAEDEIFDTAYVDSVAARVAAQITHFRSVAPRLGMDAEAKGFAHGFFNHLLLSLDRYFVFRSQVIEGFNGNPLNEVRMLSAALTRGDGVLMADPSISYMAGGSVLGYQIGDAVQLDDAQFEALFTAFIGELTTRFC